MDDKPKAATVRELRPADLSRAAALLERGLGGRLQARRGELIDVLDRPGLVAEADGALIGLLVYDLQRVECELVAIVAAVRGSGIGSALVAALRERVPDRPIWVVTTNDNLDALRFYQRLGFRLRELRAGAVDDARRTIKPTIAEVGEHGIPLRDELELVLPPGAGAGAR